VKTRFPHYWKMFPKYGDFWWVCTLSSKVRKPTTRNCFRYNMSPTQNEHFSCIDFDMKHRSNLVADVWFYYFMRSQRTAPKYKIINGRQTLFKDNDFKHCCGVMMWYVCLVLYLLLLVTSLSLAVFFLHHPSIWGQYLFVAAAFRRRSLTCCQILGLLLGPLPDAL
jgi:hypothetical protein